MNIQHIWQVNDIQVFYNPQNDGGGRTFAIDYINYLQNQKYNHVLEWCAGPGFIGFALLASGICNHVTLLECDENAIIDINNTLDSNPHIKDNVTVIHTDNIQSLSETHQFNLIVGNPPHFKQFNSQQYMFFKNIPKENWNRLAVDKNWHIHTEFFAHIDKNMSQLCEIILLENVHNNEIHKIAEKFNFNIVSSTATESNHELLKIVKF